MTLEELTKRLNELDEKSIREGTSAMSHVFARKALWAEYKAAQEGGAK